MVFFLSGYFWLLIKELLVKEHLTQMAKQWETYLKTPRKEGKSRVGYSWLNNILNNLNFFLPPILTSLAGWFTLWGESPHVPRWLLWFQNYCQMSVSRGIVRRLVSSPIPLFKVTGKLSRAEFSSQLTCSSVSGQADGPLWLANFRVSS